MQRRYGTHHINMPCKWTGSAGAALALLTLSACGGGSSSGSPSPAPGPQPPPAASTTIRGSIGDGPISGAAIAVLSSSGQVLADATSGQDAAYTASVNATSQDFPLLLRASGGTDLVAGGPPPFEVQAVLLAAGTDQVLNANPFTTLITYGARALPAGATSTTVATLRDAVFAHAGFGLTRQRMADPMSTQIDENNAAFIVKASECLAETARRTHAVQGMSAGLDIDDIMSAIAADLSDGSLDGVGTGATDVRTTATWKLASAQVLFEALTNDLKVNGTSATVLMDAAIVTITGRADAPTTATIAIDAATLGQWRSALAAAAVIAPSPSLVALARAASDLVPGMTTDDVAAMLPADAGTLLQSLLPLPAGTSDDTLARIAGDNDPVLNTPPQLAGTPPATVLQDATYGFVPASSDTDGDALEFSITGAPTWSTFDTLTGSMSGSPGNGDVGLTEGIVISVNDGRSSVALPAFSVEVINVNDAPLISGQPASSVDRGAFYEFTPVASDPDGDSLTFSVINPPPWASFDAQTGRLSGTPAISDLGIHVGVTIEVSDGVVFATLPAFDVTVLDLPLGSARLLWTPPVLSADQTPLEDLAGYRIYYSTTPGSFEDFIDVPSPDVTSFNIDGLAPATWHFVITAYDIAGNESDFSNSASKSID